MFCVSFNVAPDFELANGFTIPTDRGLVKVEVHRDTDTPSCSAVTYWNSQQSYIINRHWIFAVLGKDATEATRGHLTGVHLPKQPLRKRLPIYGAAMAILGFFGALEVAQSRYGVFFGEPDAVAFVEGGDPLRVLSNEPINLTFRAENHSRTVTANITGIGIEIRPTNFPAAEPIYRTDALKNMGPLSPSDQIFANIQVEPLPTPGEYRIETLYIVKGGLFNPGHNQIATKTLEVWAALEEGRPILEETVSDHLAWAKLPLKVGGVYPAGVTCQAEILMAGITFIGVDSRTIDLKASEVRPTSSTDGFAYVEWRTATAGPMRKEEFFLGVRSVEPRTDWEKLFGNLRWECNR